MTYTTLDYLENYIQQEKVKKRPKHILGELKTLIFIFIACFLGTLVFTNAQVFFNINNKSTLGVDRNRENIQINNEISMEIQNLDTKKEELNELLSKYGGEDFIQKQTTETISESLQGKLKTYSFDFDVVPPTNRIVIGKINLDVPLVNSKYKKESDFTQGNFDSELENGVVKYPTTPNPGVEGNTLLFGHTSQEWREKNPYGTVFSKIPNLEIGDSLSIIREGKLYQYEIIEKIIVMPKNVNSQYQKYQDMEGDFVTLMGCYPIGRTDKRMMLTAKKIINLN